MDPRQLASMGLLLSQPQQGAGQSTAKGFPPRTQRTGAPLQLVRGERRQIEEEIANRILSDISEENSVAGSDYASDLFRQGRRGSIEDVLKRRSASSTPQPSTEASSTTTPIASPAPTGDSGSALGHQQFFPEDIAPILTTESAMNPLNKQLYIDNDLLMGGASVDAELLALQMKSSRGTKSAVQLSPGQEHAMQVIIATAKGKENQLAENGGVAYDLPNGDTGDQNVAKMKLAGGESADKKAGTMDPDWRVKYRPPPDVGYDLLMAEIGRIKENIRMEVCAEYSTTLT